MVANLEVCEFPARAACFKYGGKKNTNGAPERLAWNRKEHDTRQYRRTLPYLKKLCCCSLRSSSYDFCGFAELWRNICTSRRSSAFSCSRAYTRLRRYSNSFRSAGLEAGTGGATVRTSNFSARESFFAASRLLRSRIARCCSSRSFMGSNSSSCNKACGAIF